MDLLSTRIHNNTAAADGGGLALLSAQHAAISSSSVQHNQVRGRLQLPSKIQLQLQLLHSFASSQAMECFW